MICPSFAHKSGVYQIRNIETGKRYIGSSVYLQKRWWTHLRDLNLGTHHCEHLQRSWSKRKGLGFVFEPLLYCTPANVVWYEQQFIDALNPEFNTCSVAGSCLGVKLTAEHKAKIGNAHRGMKRTEQTKANISKGQKGRKLSAEQIQKMKDWASRPENSRVGKPMSESARINMKAAAKRKVLTQEHLDKLEQARRAKATLTHDQVREVRRLRSLRYSYQGIANALGVSKNVIGDIIRGATYTYVLDEPS